MSTQDGQDIRIKLVTCNACRGSGWIKRNLNQPAEKCPKCVGKGRNEKFINNFHG